MHRTGECRVPHHCARVRRPSTSGTNGKPRTGLRYTDNVHNRVPLAPSGSSVLDVHVEVAFAHTGGMPVAIHQFCLAQRRMTARISDDNSVEYREDPRWFTAYYRRETVD